MSAPDTPEVELAQFDVSEEQAIAALLARLPVADAGELVELPVPAPPHACGAR
ncbi:hypothetical protein [Nonomuraea aurantiaca]|uniref:hypothetical protein n=1 Tax=Nonomuraea aurantiaca TaxID=2878562 RepID=UPI001CD94416|nr:hypothetical protein [Nonomuraea aurantiaca]MCA2230264.1 hypothetical protein [Nonomuraea aurantiaca]